MPLLLKIFSRTNEGLRLSDEVALEGEHVTVGRSKECTLSLADPEKRLSRIHAEIVRTPQGYLLRSMSVSSPVLVNGRLLAPGAELIVKAGDTLTLGIYDLEIVSATGLSIDPVGTGMQAGELIAGRFRIQERIAAGRTETIYRAHDEVRDDDIALTVMAQGLLDSDQARQWFMREAKVAIKLAHPGIIATYDLQIEGPCVFLTTELLRGQTLRAAMDERSRTGQTWGEQEALAIVMPLAEALDYAHRFTVHQDIKPENVWLDHAGSARLTGFGIARGLPGGPVAQAAGSGMAGYLAPELLSGANDVDHRADQYALGAMLYEMLVGRVPAGRIESSGAARADLSRGICAAMDKALSGNVQDRFATDALFLDALRAAGQRPSLPAAFRQRLGTWARPAKWLGIGAASFAGVLALVLAWPIHKGTLPDRDGAPYTEQGRARHDSLIKGLAYSKLPDGRLYYTGRYREERFRLIRSQVPGGNSTWALYSGPLTDRVRATFIDKNGLTEIQAMDRGYRITLTYSAKKHIEYRLYGPDRGFLLGSVLYRDKKRWMHGMMKTEAFSGYAALANVSDVTARLARRAPSSGQPVTRAMDRPWNLSVISTAHAQDTENQDIEDSMNLFAPEVEMAEQDKKFWGFVLTNQISALGVAAEALVVTAVETGVVGAKGLGKLMLDFVRTSEVGVVLNEIATRKLADIPTLAQLEAEDGGAAPDGAGPPQPSAPAQPPSIGERVITGLTEIAAGAGKLVDDVVALPEQLRAALDRRAKPPGQDVPGEATGSQDAGRTASTATGAPTAKSGEQARPGAARPEAVEVTERFVPLSRPTNFTATKTGDFTWKLAWDEVFAASEYYIYQQAGSAPSVIPGAYRNGEGKRPLRVVASGGYGSKTASLSSRVEGPGTYYWVLAAIRKPESDPKYQVGTPTSPVTLTFAETEPKPAAAAAAKSPPVPAPKTENCVMTVTGCLGAPPPPDAKSATETYPSQKCYATYGGLMCDGKLVSPTTAIPGAQSGKPRGQ